MTILISLATSYIAFFLYWAFCTWILFLAVMKLKNIRDTTGFTIWNIAPAYFVLGIGYFYDAVLGLITSVILLDMPRFKEKEYILSPHLSRIIRENDGFAGRWTVAVARFICKNYLVPADKGHCG